MNEAISNTVALAMAAQAAAEKPASSGLENSSAWPALAALTLYIHVQIPMPRMKVRDVVALRQGMLLISEVAETDDVAFGASGVQLGWCEFSVVDDRIGIRLTRSA